MANLSHDPDKEQLWRRIISQWQHSGLSIRAFCQRHGLAEPTFYAWRRTLRERDAAAVPFVPVHVLPDEPALSPDDPTPALELVLRGGRRLRIAPGFDAATLQRLLALLEEGPPC
jgi:hypothetical protein